MFKVFMKQAKGNVCSGNWVRGGDIRHTSQRGRAHGRQVGCGSVGLGAEGAQNGWPAVSPVTFQTWARGPVFTGFGLI